MGFAPLFHSVAYEKWTQLSSRAVKGVRLKICCICFVGSNPTSTKSTFGKGWAKVFGKYFPTGLLKNNCLSRKVFCSLSSVGRASVLWAESREFNPPSEHFWSSLWSLVGGALREEQGLVWSRWLERGIFTPETRVRVPLPESGGDAAQGANMGSQVLFA